MDLSTTWMGLPLRHPVVAAAKEALKGLVDGLSSWLQARDYDSLEQAKGSMSQANAPDPGAFVRANYMRALTSWTAG